MVSVKPLSAIISGMPPLASPVSYNFSAIATALNSNKCNSDNYSASGAYSNNIVAGAILSQHLSTAAALPAAKIGSGAVSHNNLILTGASHVKLLNVGAASSNMPSSGVRVAIASKALTITDVSNSVTISFSQNSVYGPPVFTATPAPLGHPTFIFADATGLYGVDKVKIQSINTGVCVVHFIANEVSNSEAATIQVAVLGAV